MSSRTYKASDWSIWLYYAWSGRFRLDYSVLNGPETLSLDEGFMEKLAIGTPTSGFTINNFSITESMMPTQSVISGVQGSTAQIEIEVRNAQKDYLDFFYVGRRIDITLNNGGTSTGIWGMATPYFIGKIDSVSISVDPQTKLAHVSLSATDDLTAALNTQITINKSTSSPKYSQINSAVDRAMAIPGYFPEYFSFSGVWDTINATYSTSGIETKTLGEWLDDWAFSNAGLAFYSNFILGGNSIDQMVPSFWQQIPKSKIYDVTLGVDGADRPTAFSISTPSGATVTYGDSASNQLTGAILYSATSDTPTATISTAIQALLNYRARFSPTSVQVMNYYQNHTINFTPSYTGEMYWPDNVYQIGSDINFDIGIPGFSLDDTKTTIMGVTHNVNPDEWTTTYELWKGNN